MVFLLGGAKESARANTIMVCVKIAALVLFCAIGFMGFRAGNYAHFMPLGMAGVSAAGATLFFSYIGFDAASTAGEEAKNAQRDLPRAIMLSPSARSPGGSSTTPRPPSPRSCGT
jgi:APA family basic amino acid/polyamine antiporter